ncbi:hypothetical protein QTN47_19980 [Danxiaibacter flavus]|uniref:Lipoprotein n=1 Tax=Danxiaibacter flavus TaxID=3049108 RepID=A0ABV3ZIT2_9BACT|nr:hypothetical protein QNM32_19990 [Chitinophagaceae bacterium DXS]
MKKLIPFALMLATLSACTNPNTQNQSDSVGNGTTEDSLQGKISGTLNDTTSLINKTAALVKTTLSDLYKEDLAKNVVDTASRKFIFSEQDLNGDGKNEIFVGTTGPYFCGSGGCTILLLESDGKLINRFTVIGYPVFVTSEKTNGWNNLVVSSDNKKRLLKFDGKKYPENPSAQPVYSKTVNDQLPRALDMDNDQNRWFTF